MGFEDDWQAWREAREERLRSATGWLAITSIHWLGEEPQRFDDVPGEWRQDADGPVVDERRQLLLDPPDADRITIDFNRAHNMPCAYTDFATCPVPPQQNTLPFAVEAGEQTPRMEP